MKLIFLISFILLSSALLSQSEIKDDKFFIVAEVEPEFPGGIKELYKYISSNFNYPVYPVKKKSSLDFSAKFIIEADGSITNMSIKSDSLHNDLKEEIIEVLNIMPEWKPASQNGRKVRYLYKLPLYIKLEQ